MQVQQLLAPAKTQPGLSKHRIQDLAGLMTKFGADTVTLPASPVSVHTPEVQAYLRSFPIDAPPPFNAAFHADRRQALLAQLPPNTTVIIPGATLKRRNGDVDYPFRQDSNFYYLTGFDEPDAVAILSNQPGQPVYTLVVPPRDPAWETWTGKRAGVTGAREKYGADAAFDNTQLSTVIANVAQKGGKLAVLPTVAFEDANKQVRWELFKALDLRGKLRMVATELIRRTVELLKLNIRLESTEHTVQEALDNLRLIKTPYEIALLKRACDISAQAHARTMRSQQLKSTRHPHSMNGRNEGQLQSGLEAHFRRHGAVRVGYDSIVGGGKNGCVLHYNTNREYAKPGDLVLIDAGAEYGYYTADVTRTWPLNGRFTEPQKAIYDLVLKAQEAGIRMTRPGVTIAQIHETCARIITNGLVELGILKGDPEELYRKRAYTPYFMHGTSHMLGLDVHDVPYQNTTIDGVPLRNANARNLPLKPGMVLTVEPGIYIDPDVAQKDGLDPKWHGIGVRIEDDILVTNHGCENLSDGVPRETQAIEAWMRRR